MFIQLKNLRKDYPRNNQLFSAVNNVSIVIERGDFLCIMGKSGSGKTTLLNMIAGLLTPTAGQVIINETNIFTLSDKAVSAFRNQHIGYIPQGSSLLANLTALENICLPFSLSPRSKGCLEQAQNLMEKAGISHLNHSYPAQMSGGEMRRIAIIRALICNPDILIADEPTSDLDEDNSELILQMLSEINQAGTTLIVVTHDSDVAAYAKRILNMSAGQLVGCSVNI